MRAARREEGSVVPSKEYRITTPEMKKDDSEFLRERTVRGTQALSGRALQV